VAWGELLTRWTVRLALCLYAATVALRLAAPDRRRAARGLWTLGCALFLAHVACAFHSFHGWSHDHAYRETARQTREMFGVDWGGGLYFNYLFTLAWVTDAFYWWWAGLEAYDRRPRWVAGVLHLFFGFMAFNGAVVFGRGATRWVGAAVAAGLVLFALARLRRVREGRLGRLG
jgi:hypothetical protein